MEMDQRPKDQQKLQPVSWGKKDQCSEILIKLKHTRHNITACMGYIILIIYKEKNNAGVRAQCHDK